MTFRDFNFLIFYFKNVHRITNIEPKCICINKIMSCKSEL